MAADLVERQPGKDAFSLLPRGNYTGERVSGRPRYFFFFFSFLLLLRQKAPSVATPARGIWDPLLSEMCKRSTAHFEELHWVLRSYYTVVSRSSRFFSTVRVKSLRFYIREDFMLGKVRGAILPQKKRELNGRCILKMNYTFDLCLLKKHPNFYALLVYVFF